MFYESLDVWPVSFSIRNEISYRFGSSSAVWSYILTSFWLICCAICWLMVLPNCKIKSPNYKQEKLWLGWADCHEMTEHIHVLRRMITPFHNFHVHVCCTRSWYKNVCCYIKMSGFFFLTLYVKCLGIFFIFVLHFQDLKAIVCCSFHAFTVRKTTSLCGCL